MTSRIAIVDVGMGNLRSVTKAVEAAGAELSVSVVRTRDPDVVRGADRLVGPGPGSFGELSQRLAGGLSEAILERLRAGAPYLGICLGLQLLFEDSEEAPGVAGFGWFRGSVKKLVGGPDVKIPHMGWNQIEAESGGHPIVDAGEWFYFVHSYHALPSEPGVLRGVSGYGPNRVTAVVAREQVMATQFHPEKSQQAGLSLLTRFLRG